LGLFLPCVQITGLASPGPQVAAKNYKAIKTKPSTTTYYPPGPPRGTGLHRYGRFLHINIQLRKLTYLVHPQLSSSSRNQRQSLPFRLMLRNIALNMQIGRSGMRWCSGKSTDSSWSALRTFMSVVRLRELSGLCV
jgi:hypothetical protein